MTIDTTKGSPVRVTIGSFVTVIVIVVLNLAAAILLKILASQGDLSVDVLVVGILVAAGLNGLRFLVWGFAHSRYLLSTTYPLSSMFFPAILAVSWFFGEEVGLKELVGTVLIVCGVLWLTLSGQGKGDEHNEIETPL